MPFTTWSDLEKRFLMKFLFVLQCADMPAQFGYTNQAPWWLPGDNDTGAYPWIQSVSCHPDTFCFMPSGYILFHAIRIQSVSCHPDTICFMPSGYNLFHAIWIHSVSWDPDTFCFMRSGYNLFHAIRIQSVSCHPDTKVIICYSLYLATETGYELYPRLPINRILHVYSNKKLTFTLVADPWKNR